ncbi:MAG: SIS domain-containing protein [Firmicutes bacterium]|jgi:arabinose-5-phosphate isomerase|nr:SIS domain-containing protein [Bacillota bacterium]
MPERASRVSPAVALGREVVEREARALLDMAEKIGPEFERAVTLLSECEGKVVVTGMGKSGLICRKIAATLSSLGTPALFLHAGDALHGDSGVLAEEDVVLAVSHSGETAELLALLPLIRSAGSKIISISGNLDCSLARSADVALCTGVGTEADPRGLAPTSSSTATLALGDALALCVAEADGFTADDFHAFHPGGSLGKALSRGRDNAGRPGAGAGS